MSVKGLGEECELIVEGQPLSATIDDEIVNIQFIGSIAGASTVTIKAIDPEKKLQKAGYFQPFVRKKVRKETKKEKEKRAGKKELSNEIPVLAECLLVDEGEKKAGLRFEACSFKKTADEFQLEFEDRDVAILREDKSEKAVSASRANMTRAQFVEKLVHQAAPHIKFHSPGKKEKQPIEAAKRPKKKASTSLPKGAAITIGGRPPDPDQRKNIATVLAVCNELNAPALAVQAIVQAGLGESSFHTHDKNSIGADGVFQLLPSTAAGTGLSPYDTKGTARYWLEHGYYGHGGGIKIAREHPDWTPGEIATAVEGSYAEEAGRFKKGGEYYDKYKGEAEKIIQGGGGAGTAEKEEYAVEYKFERKAGEGTWECAQRLAEEVGWRCFMRYGEMWFMNDLELADSGTPLAIDENSPGVVNINWEIDKSEKKKPKVTIEARAGAWTVPPGKPVELLEQVGEPVIGLWIVSEIIRKDITDNAVEIILSKPEAPKNEPATKFKTKTTPAAIASPNGTVASQDGSGSGTDAGERQTNSEGELKGTSLGLKLFNQCKWIAEQHLPYVWGGGHSGFFPSTTGGQQHPNNLVELVGLDCSGAVSWALHSSGMFPFISPMGSGEIALEWGDVGKGRFFTVWANTDHVFIEFGPALCRTSAFTFWAAKHTGTIVGFSSTEEATTNFTPKHWPGL